MKRLSWVLALALACGGDDDVLVDAGFEDAAVDAGFDAGSDAGTDGGSDAGVDGGPPLLACPTFAEAVQAGQTPVETTDALREISGVAASRRNPGVLWVHNDSGDRPRVSAITPAGARAAVFELEGAEAVDWEDVAVGPGPVDGTSYLYLADVGDNLMLRPTVQVYRVPEPEVDASTTVARTTLSGVERLELDYPDGAHNCETAFVDPRNGDLYLVTKSADGVSPVFRAAAPLAAGSTLVLERVAELAFGRSPLVGNPETTGGDLTASGDSLAIRSYTHAYFWWVGESESIGAALLREPCPIPQHAERQGEALGFAADGSGYYTISEGQPEPIWFYARE
ncbi:MAG: hypothetical protein H6720_11305 [Sandaracinus sp.]|nr:hypothetical protein [Sandaracinus sp.]